MLDTALRLMNRHSRVVLCGLVAEYGATEPYGYQRLRSVLVNRIRMQGMIVFDWKDRYGEALARPHALTLPRAGSRIANRSSKASDSAPRALIGLLQGRELRQAAGQARVRRPQRPSRHDLEQSCRAHAAADAHRHDDVFHAAPAALDAAHAP